MTENDELEIVKDCYEEVTRGLEGLEDDWDGYGSKGYSKEQTTEAIKFIVELKSLFKKHNVGFVYPSIFPYGDGLVLEWFFPKKFDLKLFVYICKENDMNWVEIDACTFEGSYRCYNKEMTRDNMDEGLFDWLKENITTEFFDWANETMEKEKGVHDNVQKHSNHFYSLTELNRDGENDRNRTNV